MLRKNMEGDYSPSISLLSCSIIAFNATVKQTPSLFGNKITIVVLDNIKLTGKNIQINPHVHEKGRYGTSGGQFEEGKQIYRELPNVITGKKNLKQKNLKETND